MPKYYVREIKLMKVIGFNEMVDMGDTGILNINLNIGFRKSIVPCLCHAGK